MERNYLHMEMTQLMDMLSEETKKFTEATRKRTDKQRLEALEIELRKIQYAIERKRTNAPRRDMSAR